jgi:hypothetical protein
VDVGEMPVLAALLLAALGSVPLVLWLVWGRKNQRVTGPTWDCGLPGLTADNEYTATAFSKPLMMVFNAVSLVKAALRAVHGRKKVDQEVSGYYLSLEIQHTYDGMMIAVPNEHWTIFRDMTDAQFARIGGLLGTERGRDVRPTLQHRSRLDDRRHVAKRLEIRGDLLQLAHFRQIVGLRVGARHAFREQLGDQRFVARA